MSEDLFVRQCAPTLAGLKTGNLFSCSFKNENEMKESVRSINRCLRDKGLRFIPMKFRGTGALLYLYRPDKLKTDLSSSHAKEILSAYGYPHESAEKCVSCLRRKLSVSDAFPHEIGLFLGYPPEDVRGFIEQGARNCKCSGCWKVYGDEASAKETFVRYKKCKDVYCRRHSEGYSVEKLTVVLKEKRG